MTPSEIYEAIINREPANYFFLYLFTMGALSLWAGVSKILQTNSSLIATFLTPTIEIGKDEYFKNVWILPYLTDSAVDLLYTLFDIAICLLFLLLINPNNLLTSLSSLIQAYSFTIAIVLSCFKLLYDLFSIATIVFNYKLDGIFPLQFAPYLGLSRSCDLNNYMNQE